MKLANHIMMLTTFCYQIHGKSIVGPRNEDECRGLIRLRSSCGFVQEYSGDQRHLNFNAAKAFLEGCGCYRLYERRRHRGKSYTVDKIGDHTIRLRRVRSLEKIKCPGDVMLPNDLALPIKFSNVVVHEHKRKNRRKGKNNKKYGNRKNKKKHLRKHKTKLARRKNRKNKSQIKRRNQQKNIQSQQIIEKLLLAEIN